MKRLRIVLVSLFALAVVLAVLIWFLPASWAVLLFGAQLRGLRVQGLHGLVWQGSAEHVYAANGTDLGNVSWSLSRRALIDDVWLDLDVHQPQLQFSGQMHRLSATTVDWGDVRLRVDTAMLGPQSWLNNGQPEGWLDIRAAQVRLEGNWPTEVKAAGQWQNAAMRERDGSVLLGSQILHIDAQGGIVQATMHDDGRGPLQLEGRLSGSPLGWSLTINLSQRRADPRLGAWIRSFGKPAADGTLYLHYRGGLVALSPSTEQR